jgi:hypothetical protein
MIRITHSPLRLAVAAILSFITVSCNKSGNLPSEQQLAKLCPIRSLSFSAYDGGPRDTITFAYDWLGRPVSSTRTNTGTGSPKYLFRYDTHGNLRDFIGAYDNGGAEFWTRYTYSSDNRTEWDTTYTLVRQYVIWPPNDPEAELTVTHIKKYDRKGRVIRIFTPYSTPIVFQDTVYTGHTQTFTYDLQGEAIGLGPYDNKINYHQANVVWQFIDDQYSANNSFPIDTYNVLGLPTRFDFNLNGTFPYPSLFNLEFPDVVIDYGCDLTQTPHQKG